MSEMKIGFELRKIRLTLEVILPMRMMKPADKRAHRYKTILSSIPVVGLVEPLVVYPQKGLPGKYMLKNGHLRYYALKDLGIHEADCIIATDDECYTYNARVSRLPPIQEHKMIVKAVKNGVSPEQLATALNMPLRVVQASMNLLNGKSRLNTRPFTSNARAHSTWTPRASPTRPRPMRCVIITSSCENNWKTSPRASMELILTKSAGSRRKNASWNCRPKATSPRKLTSSSPNGSRV